ncbi:MAG TPA: phage tail tube protein [Arthrobacter sp.]|nr:phage tail tube protein [Arthrobacter sp.]
MSSYFINGAQFSFSTALDTALAVSAITNADPAVASALTPPADGSIVIVKSGWSGLNETIARTANSDTSTFELEGVDTSNTTWYPAGSGSGSVQEVTTWQLLSQIRAINPSGGDPQTFEYQYADDPTGRRLIKPTGKNGRTLALSMDKDSSQSWFSALVAADRSRSLVAMKAVSDEGTTLYLGYMSFDQDGSKPINENKQVVATLTQVCEPIVYPAA